MNVNDLRKKIDEIDLELLTLLQERMELGLRTARQKQPSDEKDFEKHTLDRAIEKTLALVKSEFAEEIFSSIINESKRIQSSSPPLVGFQGEHGAYSEVASRTLIQNGAYMPCAEFAQVFDGVEKGLYDLGVIPVENSLEGAVTQVNELLATTQLHAVGEAIIPVRHCLLAPEGTDHRELRVVYSHPQALAQCHNFIERNKLEPRPFYDTAGAAKMISREKPKTAAAIASKLAAKLYGLEIIKEGVENDQSNSTRFLMLSKEKQTEPGNKCSLSFAVSDKAGRLYKVLGAFAEKNINLTRIASFPRKADPGNYSFFLDFEGSDSEDDVKRILEFVEKSTIEYKFLGCYKAAVRPGV